jgi:LPS-assembly lipoprotein
MHAAAPSRGWRRRTLLLVPCVLLAGCGFHLQGRVTLPRSLANVQIEATDQQSDFYSSLRTALSAAGSKLDGPAADSATIHILTDSSSERVITVSARNTPTAYALDYKVKLAVEYQGRELLPAEEHALTREYSFDETELLAKQRESEMLRQALADDLVALVMRRLAAL